jgi:hypothetical protein
LFSIPGVGGHDLVLVLVYTLDDSLEPWEISFPASFFTQKLRSVQRILLATV